MIAIILPAGVASAEAGAEPALPLLPDEAAALGAVSDLRRDEFTLGRSCARRALMQLGAPATPILIGPDREPLWPDGIVGSIAHCPGYCAAVAAPRAPLLTIGIDAEVNQPLPPGVFDMIATEPERLSLPVRPGDDICWDRVLFCAKESLYKAWFPIARRWLGFKDAVVTLDRDAGTFGIRLEVAAPMQQRPPVIRFSGRWLANGRHIVAATFVEATSNSAAAVGEP
jgi:4'-phosphopantetheinyl transferase EntD